MRVIRISDNQFVPAHNIDAVMILNEDPKSLVVRTVGGFQITTLYSNKDMCRQDYEKIFNELEKK